MARDPYGYSEPDRQEAHTPSGAVDVLAGLGTLVWLGLAVGCCGVCSGVMPFYEPGPGDTWMDAVGVWLILTVLAWPLAAIAFWTGLLHGVARRWWTSAGPNVVLGAASGCALWCVVLVVWVFAVVIVQGG